MMRRCATRWFLALTLAGALALPVVQGVSAQGLFDKAKEALGGFGKALPGMGGLTTDEIAQGLREALKVGTERVVGQVGAVDGFNADPDIHIPLPGSLKNVQSLLAPIGLSRLTDDLETRLNRGAEAAAPEAKAVLWEAISEMTLDDVQRIYDGPDDAATQYFKDKMNQP